MIRVLKFKGTWKSGETLIPKGSLISKEILIPKGSLKITGILAGMIALTFLSILPGYANSGTRLSRDQLINQSQSIKRGDFRVAISSTNAPSIIQSETLKSFIQSNFRPAKLPSITAQKRITQLFNNKDIVVLIDKSSSMRTADINGSMSRWEWSGQQLSNLAYNLNYAPLSNLDVVLFDNKPIKYRSVSIRSMPSIFSQNLPSGGTNVTRALKEELDSYFDRKKLQPASNRPLVVAVITDGAPSSARSLKDLIINATHRLENRNQLKISFLQIGQENQGNRLLPELDNGLVNEGARLDIVDSKPFYEVQRKGLLEVLLDVVSTG